MPATTLQQIAVSVEFDPDNAKLCACDVSRALSRGRRAWNRTRDCRTRDAFRLSAAQRDVCRQHLDLMPAVTRAAKTTADACQQLFADKRWNCSSVLLAPRFTPDLTGGMTKYDKTVNL